jgi:hypothetical protein
MGMDSKTVLIFLVVLSLIVGGYEAAAFYDGRLVGAPFQAVWSLAFLLLLVFWLELDSKKHKNVYRPFEFGFLIFLSWPLYLPYYLVRTRRAFGVVWLVAFVGLFYLGFLLQLLIYAVR